MRFLLSVVIMTSGLFACTKRRDLSQNTVIVHILAEPKGIHPTNDHNAYQRMIFQCTQKRLITTNIETNKLMPDLLTALPEMQEDSLSYFCTLRDGIRWDDGSELSFDDILFTFKVITCPLINNPETKSYFNKLENIIPDKNDPKSFLITSTKRYFDNASMLSYAIILQKKHWDPDGIMNKYKISQFQNTAFKAEGYADLKQLCSNINNVDNGRVPLKMVGLGAYQVTDWQTGSSITIERKKNWWADSSKLAHEQNYPEKIIFTVISDMEPVVLALKKQEIDVATELTTPALQKLIKLGYFNDNYISDYIGSYSYTYFGMNLRPEGERPAFFTDKRVRKAFAHLVPVDEIIAVIAKGKARRVASFVQPDQQEFNKNIPLVSFNLQKGRQLLTEAGWVDSDGDNIRDKLINGKRVPFSFSLSYMISPVTREITMMIRNELYKAGIDAQPDPMEFSVFYEKAGNHNFDAMLGSWSSSALPDDPRALWHTASWVSKGFNFTGFGTPQTDSLIEVANQELNPVKRSATMGLLQEIVADEQPYVFLFNATRKIAVHRRFENIGLYPERPHLLLGNLKLSEHYANSKQDIN